MYIIHNLISRKLIWFRKSNQKSKINYLGKINYFKIYKFKKYIYVYNNIILKNYTIKLLLRITIKEINIEKWLHFYSQFLKNGYILYAISGQFFYKFTHKKCKK